MSSGALNGSISEAQRATRQAAGPLLGLSGFFRWVIVSSSDEVLWMVDVSIVLSRIRHSQASQVGSFRQILARILRSDGSVLAWIINI